MTLNWRERVSRQTKNQQLWALITHLKKQQLMPLVTPGCKEDLLGPDSPSTSDTVLGAHRTSQSRGNFCVWQTMDADFEWKADVYGLPRGLAKSLLNLVLSLLTKEL